MKFPLSLRSILFAISVLAIAAIAHAQDDVPSHEAYLTFALDHVNTVPNDGGTAFNGTTSVASPGLGIGITWDVAHFPVAVLGVDLRVSFPFHPSASDATTPGSPLHTPCFSV